MRLKKLDLSKKADNALFVSNMEKLDSYVNYGKQLRRAMKTLKSSWVDFYFFHKFKFGSKPNPCFLFGDLTEHPWATLVDGGYYTYEEDDEEIRQLADGWKNEYKSARGLAKRKRMPDAKGYIIYLKVRGGKSIIAKYEEVLEGMFTDVFGEGAIDVHLLGEDEEDTEDALAAEESEDEKALFDALKVEINELREVDKEDFFQQLEEIEDIEELLEEWNSKYPNGAKERPDEFKLIERVTKRALEFRDMESIYNEVLSLEEQYDQLLTKEATIGLEQQELINQEFIATELEKKMTEFENKFNG